MKLEDVDAEDLERLLVALARIRELNASYMVSADNAVVMANRREFSATEHARLRGLRRNVRKVETVVPDSKYL